MRLSPRVPAALALVAALVGVPAGPAAAELDRPVVLLEPEYICLESAPLSDPARWSATALAPAAEYQKCQLRFGLSQPGKDEVVVYYRTEPGSATPQLDYVEVRDGKAAIPPGETAGYLTVLVVSDQVREPDETFAVVLGKAIGADIGRQVAEVTIREPDRSGD